MLPAEVAAKFRTSISQAMLGEAVEFEYELCIRGQTRQYEARMVRRDSASVVCIVRNISKRSQALRQLRESEERFRGLFEHSAIGLAIVGLDGHWIRANAAACAILGYSDSELRSLDFQSITHPDDLGTNLERFREALQGGIEHYQLEKRYLHKDGRYIPVFLSVSIVRDERRNPLYFVSQLLDLSATKDAMLENERLRHELAHCDRLALAGQLTASLAHELLQPITAMQANAQACQRLLAQRAADLPEVHEGLQDIVANSSRAADVINNVRRLLRREPGSRQSVVLNRLVEQVIEVTRQDLMHRKVRLAAHLDPSLPQIMGNPIELQQVLLNLLLNGMEALQSVPSRREITIESARLDGVVRLSVHDSGRGVDPVELRRIFDPFYTTKPQGLGMGLTISADIVHAHGGAIWAERNSLGGMTVRCTFPFDERR
jgi:PAS domain S-box-containing protein